MSQKLFLQSAQALQWTVGKKCLTPSMSFGSTGILAIRNWIYLRVFLTHPRGFISWKLKPAEFKVENGPIQPTENLSFSWSACVSLFRGRQNCCETHEGQGKEQKELKALIFQLLARWQALPSNLGRWLLHLLSTVAKVVGSSNMLKLDYQRELWLLLTLWRSIFWVQIFSYRNLNLFWLFIIETPHTCFG